MFKNGVPCENIDENLASKILKRKEISIILELDENKDNFSPENSVKYWTCDFSYDYVKINADYRS